MVDRALAMDCGMGMWQRLINEGFGNRVGTRGDENLVYSR